LIRVTKKDGLIFVNFLSTADERNGEGVCVGNGEFEPFDEDYQVIHSYFEYNEADSYFENLENIFKEVREVFREYQGKIIKQGFIDYILKKR